MMIKVSQGVCHIKDFREMKEVHFAKRYQGKSGNLILARDSKGNIRDIVCLCFFRK